MNNIELTWKIEQHQTMLVSLPDLGCESVEVWNSLNHSEKTKLMNEYLINHKQECTPVVAWWSERFPISLKRIQSFSKLKENWNGYGSVGISPLVIERAISFYNSFNPYLLHMFYVFPTALGEIQFEYEKQNLYIEFSITEDSYELFIEEDGIDSEYSFTSLDDLIEKVYSKMDITDDIRLKYGNTLDSVDMFIYNPIIPREKIPQITIKQRYSY